MGACVSVHHKASAMKVQASFDSTDDLDHKAEIHPSPSKGKPPIINGLVAVKPQLHPSQSPAAFSDFGSKEEIFFDSQAWLDSDYEDDFVSVNGEFTPSRGNTPLHHSLAAGTPRVDGEATAMDNNRHAGSLPEPPSPTLTEKRMRLLDLFKESVRVNHDSDEEIAEPPNKHGEMASNGGGLKPKKERPLMSVQGCFRSLLSSRNSGRKKKRSPTPTPTLLLHDKLN